MAALNVLTFRADVSILYVKYPPYLEGVDTLHKLVTLNLYGPLWPKEENLGVSVVTRAYSYIRFSMKKQQQGDSFRRQKEFAIEVCKEKGWTLDDTLTLHDLGVSAFRGKNAKEGALSEFLEAVRIGRVLPGSMLIVESIDRLSRETVGHALQIFISILNNGVGIVTREPPRHYTKDSVQDIAGLLDPLIIMSRANDESKHKSMRLYNVWKKKKELASTNKTPMTRMCPHWMTVTEDRFSLIPVHAETVREIFRLSIGGLGNQRIINYLCDYPDKYPPFGNSGRWVDTYVSQILSSRATFGEGQPGMRDEDGNKAPCGQPIQNYYPAVISEDEFYAAQAAKKSRSRAWGRPGKYESNLFTSLVFCAKTKMRMSLRPFCTPKPYYYLTSAAVKSGQRRRGRGISFPYKIFEDGMLRSLSELKSDDVMEKEMKQDKREEEIGLLMGKLTVLDHRIGENEMKAADADEEHPEIYIGVLRTLYTEKKKMKRRLEELNADKATQKTANLGEVQSLIELLCSTNEKELANVRRRLKAKIRGLVSEIWVHITHINHLYRVAQIQIFFRSGLRKTFSLHSRPLKSHAAALFPEVEDLSETDLRTLVCSS